MAAAAEEAKRQALSTAAQEEQRLAKMKALEEEKRQALLAAASDEARRKAIAAKAEEDSRKKAEEENKLAELKRKQAEAKAEFESRKKEQEANQELGMKLLAEKYPERKTEEIFEDSYRKTTRITLNRDGKVIFYKKVKHNWGGMFYFKDNQSISEHQFFIDTQ